MARILFLLVALLSIGLASFGQSVIGSMGNSVVVPNSDVTVEMTIGEVLIETGSNADLLLTQGFHQPSGMIVISGIEFLNADISIEVMPNPVAHQLNVLSSATEELSFQTYDLQGKLMTSGVLTGSATRIDMRDFPNGMYTLVVRKPETAEQAVFQVVKQ